jgi:hypothetical protein
MSEGLSTALWSAGVIAMLRGALESRLPLGFAGGVSFAMASYIRTQIYGIMMIGSVLLGILVFGVALTAFVRRDRTVGPLAAILSSLSRTKVTTAIVCAIAFHLFTLPYLTLNLVKYDRFDWAIMDYYYRYMWLQPQEYPPAAGWILQGGGAVACSVSPEICAELRALRTSQGEAAVPFAKYRKFAMKAFFAHPIAWYTYKAKYIGPYWFSSPSCTTPGNFVLWPGLAITGLLAVSVYFLWSLRRSSMLFPFSYVFGSSLGGSLAVFALVHFEVRYLYHLQFSAILFAMVGGILAIEQRREIANNAATRALGNCT